jgi:hypothetical protein
MYYILANGWENALIRGVGRLVVVHWINPTKVPRSKGFQKDFVGGDGKSTRHPETAEIRVAAVL